MLKFLRRFFILFMVFIFGVAGTALMLNSETTDNRSDMNAPVLPEVMVQMGDVLANRMYGYRQHMQVDFTRDSLTPLDSSKKLIFVVNPYDTSVNSLSYEIRTSDGSKVIENKKIKNLKKLEGYFLADVSINSDLRMNQEYSMQITLDTGAGEAYYYTRVVSRPQLNTEQYVQFVKSFYEKCMDKMTADDLASYLEPEDTGASTNYANISIKSTLSEVSWGNMKPQVCKKGIPVIKEINETTASISLEYQITARNDVGDVELYDVEEFYRMRYSETRIMLLDFNRSAHQVFDPSLPVISDAGLLLGIRDKDVSYMANTDAAVVAFVQQGDLWSYSPENGKIVKIFSFRRGEGSDFRDSRLLHDIKIIRVEDNGDVDFVLYGYMNRGNHEGYCGVCVYHYSNDQNVVEEKVFIPCTESNEFLKEDLGTLSYVSSDNQLFLLFAEKLYQVDIEGGTYTVLDENISNKDFAVSDANAHAAWLISEGENAGMIKEIDFDTLETRLLQAPDGQQLRILGFMNEDMVYGLVNTEDILTDENGHVTEGMYVLRIEGFDGEVKKEYSQEGLYITDLKIGDTLMEFSLAARTEKGYKIKKKDNIMNNKKALENKVSVVLTNASRTGTMVRLAFEEAPDTDKPLLISAKMRVAEAQEVVLDMKVPQDEIYYIYASGRLAGTERDPARAILKADEKMGVVLNRAQQYVWERGNKKTKIILNIEDVPETMRDASLDKEALQKSMGEEGTIIDLSGCTLDSVLYEISAQRPVIAKTGADSSVVIVGYDEYNTYLYDSSTGETKPFGMNDSTELFEKAGNIFISYIEAANY